jgi:hypothetical protein
LPDADRAALVVDVFRSVLAARVEPLLDAATVRGRKRGS